MIRLKKITSNRRINVVWNHRQYRKTNVIPLNTYCAYIEETNQNNYPPNKPGDLASIVREQIAPIGRSHTAAMLASRLQWTMRRNVRKSNMHTSTSKTMRVAYVATFPLHCFNYFCTLTETSQYTRLAHFCLSTYACYVYERSVALFIVDGKQAWQRCGIKLWCCRCNFVRYCPISPTKRLECL